MWYGGVTPFKWANNNYHAMQNLFGIFQDSVQLRGTVDKSAEVHADQSQVGISLGVLSICQQINCP